MAFIARTYVGTQAEADKAVRYFRRASKLSKYKRIRRGHYEFIFHVPALWQRADVERAFAEAFPNTVYEPIVIEELPIDVTPEPSKPTPAEAMNKPPLTRLALLEQVNELNRMAIVHETGEMFYTVTVLYNTVIFCRERMGGIAMHDVIEGVPK